jgi:hypothetical protein
MVVAATGPAGPAGSAGAPATALWAVVDHRTAPHPQQGSASALKIGTGDYEVVFNQDVTGCNIFVRVDSTSTRVPRAGDQGLVFVAVGAPPDRPYESRGPF